MCWSLSLQFLFKKKRGMGYREKKIYGHMKVQVLEKKERKKMWAHEGP